MSIEAMKQALEAWDTGLDKRPAMEALRTAIAEAEKQEPVAWMHPSGEGYDSAFRDHSTVMACTGNKWDGWIPLYTAPPAAPVQPEQEPVHQWREKHSAYWYDGYPDNDDGGGPYETRTLYATPPAAQPAPVQEPVKPYAYEYGRDNGDGTYSVVIDKGSLVQTQPAVYNYARPQNAHKEWPIKELFDHPPAAQRQPLTKGRIGQIIEQCKITLVNYCSGEKQTEFARAIEAAHGIKGEKT
jgi:hypothetical protein